jgi:hypothetical protein
MDVRKGCWFKGCASAGEPRPMYATAHGLPATLRLCQRHMTVLSNDPSRAAAETARPDAGR